MIDEVIILAGGSGTRLKSIISDIPKPMADINGKPFLYYLISYLKTQGIKSIILSVGFKGEIIINYFGNEMDGIKLIYSIEKFPLGTGGAILKALELVQGSGVIVINGDTLFNVDLHVMVKAHNKNNAEMTIALKEMKNVERYGKVVIDENDMIIGFQEKKYFKNGLINGGIYIIKKNIFQKFSLPSKFSFEKFIEREANNLIISSYCSYAYFIDIGIPEDYYKAKESLPKIFNLTNSSMLASGSKGKFENQVFKK